MIIGPTRKDVLKDYAYKKRKQIETGGITVGGGPVATDRDSQNMISNAVAYLNAAPTVESIDFSGPVGFVNISRADMLALGIAIGAHVQQCFSTEKTLVDGINAGTITTTAQIDAAFE
jgi:hypothetical protein